MIFVYYFPITNDITHGNLDSLLTHGIPHLYTDVNHHIPNVRVFVKTSYLNE